MGLFGFLKGKKKLSPVQLEQINRRLKILQDSLRIIQNTEDLDTFFSRYDLAETTLQEISLIAGEKTPCIAGETPKDCMQSLMEQKEAQTNNCIDRYIRKETKHIIGLSRGRIKKAKGVAAIIEEYKEQMTEQNLELGRKLSKKLIEKIEKLEAE